MSESFELTSSNLQTKKNAQAIRVLENLVQQLGINLSEYDMYARYALNQFDSKTVECFWSNTSINLETVQDVALVRKISERLAKYYSSVSFHTHVLLD